MDVEVTAEKKNLMHCLFILCRDPSDWSAETMEALGPLLFLDDNATSALPNKVCTFCVFLHISSGQ